MTRAVVRSVLGDLDPATIGVTYAHEHLVIDGGRPVQLQPEFDLGDVAAMTTEVRAAAALGARTFVDAMPCDAGRNVSKLAAVARQAGVNVVAPTGLHHDRYYGPAHWRHRLSAEELADLFVADIGTGIDVYDYSGPVLRRTDHRAGVIKIAGSDGGLTDHDRVVFEAAAIAHRRTGAPILTHCEHGTGALDQLAFLGEHGVAPDRIALSHIDKVVDRGYHRELLGTGAFGEYDGTFRWPDGEPNGTLTVTRWAVEDGLGDRILFGMDAARRRYYSVFGGEPGLTWLLGGWRDLLRREGVDEPAIEACFRDNPARWLSFVPTDSPTGP